MTTEKRKQQLCRLCAETNENLIGIYETDGLQLEIEKKIFQCLQIQVFTNDYLPLFVCQDCCVLLNQCSNFHERSNQAQYSLRQMLIESKPQNQQINSSISNEYNLSCVAQSNSFLKENFVEECAINDADNDYSEDSTNDLEKVLADESTKESLEKERGCDEKKILTKLSVKKKVKKKEDHDLLAIRGTPFRYPNQLRRDSSNEEIRKIVNKIPENYMTGKKSDMELLAEDKKNSTDDRLKSERKKNAKTERYPWLCTDCNDKLPSLELLEDHHKVIHNQNPKYMCVQCCKVYEKYYGFLTHVKRHKSKTKYTCDDCGKSFVQKKVLETHRAIHSDERPHVCRTCGKAFRQQSALYIHSRCHLPEDMKNKYPCDQCDKSFTTKPNLVTHKRIHSGVRNFTCDQCGKSFIQKGNLEAHFLTHSEEKPYPCSQCTKAFKTPLQLKKHESVHTGAKPHQCAACGKTFREKGTLREHQRIHTGAMPFSCEYCGKSFRFKGILTTHRRQHTGERPYSCLECQHHFTNWPNYNKHMKRRHGIDTSQSKNQNQQVSTQQQQQEAQQNIQKLQEKEQECRDKIPLQRLHSGGQVSPTTVQAIQTAPQVTVTTQPIVLQTLPSNAAITTIQTFTETTEVPVTTASTTSTNIQQLSAPRNTTYFNPLATPISNFLPSNVSYGFYNVPNTAQPDLMHHR